MKTLLVLLVVVGSGFGCRTVHMGPDHGKAYHAALRAQSSKSGASPAGALDAADARQVMQVHRSGAQAGPQVPSAATSLETE